MSVETIDAGAAAPANDAPIAETPVETVSENSPSAMGIEKPQIDKELMAVWKKNNPARDEFGKFASDEEKPAEEGAEPAAAEPEQDSAVAPKETAEVKPEEPAIDPPQSWTAELKAKWASVPPDMREFIAKREADAHAEITRRGEQAKAYEDVLKAYDPIGQLIQSHKDDFIRRGISPVQAFETLLTAQRSLDQNPVNGLVQIGLSYGIDLRPVLQGQQAIVPAQPDPRIAELEAKLRQVEGSLTERQRQERAIAEQQLHAQEAEVQQIIGDFSKDKPYFSEVKPVMAALLSSEQAKDLAEAYDMAVNAKPEIRQRIQEDQRKAEAAKREAEAKAKADQARKSAQVNVKSSSATKTSPKTVDDTLREVARRHYGAAA